MVAENWFIQVEKVFEAMEITSDTTLEYSLVSIS